VIESCEKPIHQETEMTKLWRSVVLGTVVVVAGGLAFGGDTPWKDKPYQQWTQKDVTRILQDSPWAKTVNNVGGTLSQHGNTDLGGGEPGTMPGMGGGGVLPGEHDTSMNDDRAPKNYLVLWWSAITVRKAAARREMLTGELTAEQMDKQAAATPGDYEVLIQGVDMSIFDRRTEQSFMDKAFLQAKSSKQKIMPTKVEYLKGPNGNVTAAIFHFAAKQPSGTPVFTPRDKQADFYCHVGDGTIRTWFDFSKMTGQQGMDL
jgi:hypothetical protein